MATVRERSSDEVAAGGKEGRPATARRREGHTRPSIFVPFVPSVSELEANVEKDKYCDTDIPGDPRRVA